MKHLQAFGPFVIWGLAAAFVPVLASGCKKSTAPGSAASASASASAEPITEIKTPPGADPELFAKIAEIVQKCAVNVKEATTVCQGEETRKLGDDFSVGKRSRPDAVRTMALALESDNEKVRGATAAVLHAGFRNNWGADRKPGDVKADDAKEMIKATFALPKPYLRRALPATVHAAMLANQPDALYAALDSQKDLEIASIGLRHVMTHGRLAVFPKVQETGKSEEARFALSAIEAVQNMDKWSEDEQAAICPWLVQFLNDKRTSISARASTALNNCGGKYVDDILAAGEKAMKDNEFSSARLSGLRSMCTPSRRNQPNAPSPAQCERARALLEKVVQAPKLEVPTRSSALVALTNQWNDARTLAFVKRVQQTKPEGLTEQLKTALRRLEQKDAAPAGSAGAHQPRSSAPAPAPAPAASGKTPG
jgi:hypothetical protein